MPSRWETVTLDQLTKVPQLPAVYVFFDGKEVLYIGQSVDLRARFVQHLRDSGLKDTGKKHSLHKILSTSHAKGRVSVKFKVCSDPGEYLGLEVKLIHRLRPPCNTMGRGALDNCRLARFYKVGHWYTPAVPLRPGDTPKKTHGPSIRLWSWEKPRRRKRC